VRFNRLARHEVQPVVLYEHGDDWGLLHEHGTLREALATVGCAEDEQSMNLELEIEGSETWPIKRRT
jgi:hypothetical protein